MNNLFIICPECHLELEIQKSFSGEKYYISALGGLLEFSEFKFTEELNQFIISNEIEQVNVISKCSCTFNKNVIEGKIRDNLEIEHYINELANEYIAAASKEKPLTLTEELLGELIVNEGMKSWLNSPFIGNKIKDGQIVLKGFVLKKNNRKEINFK